MLPMLMKWRDMTGQPLLKLCSTSLAQSRCSASNICWCILRLQRLSRAINRIPLDQQLLTINGVDWLSTEESECAADFSVCTLLRCHHVVNEHPGRIPGLQQGQEHCHQPGNCCLKIQHFQQDQGDMSESSLAAVWP